VLELVDLTRRHGDLVAIDRLSGLAPLAVEMLATILAERVAAGWW